MNGLCEKHTTRADLILANHRLAGDLHRAQRQIGQLEDNLMLLTGTNGTNADDDNE